MSNQYQPTEQDFNDYELLVMQEAIGLFFADIDELPEIVAELLAVEAARDIELEHETFN